MDSLPQKPHGGQRPRRIDHRLEPDSPHYKPKAMPGDRGWRLHYTPDEARFLERQHRWFVLLFAVPVRILTGYILWLVDTLPDPVFEAARARLLRVASKPAEERGPK